MKEVHKEDGKLYQPTTVSNILAALYEYSRSCDRNCPNFMNKKDTAFKELTNSLQVCYRELCQSGIGAIIKHTPILTKDKECTL